VVCEALQTRLALQRQRLASAEAGSSSTDDGNSAHTSGAAADGNDLP